MLEGVLRHCTDMTIKRQMTDSHGQSEIGFAFSHLIQVSLALVNPLLVQDVLVEKHWKDAMKSEDWRGLTPLFLLFESILGSCPILVKDGLIDGICLKLHAC